MPARPIVIAIGGDSGSGKTTLGDGLDRVFGSGKIATIHLDNYHSLDRAQRAAVGLTAIDPRASNFAAMEEDLWALREGRAVDRPTYDHATGTFGAPQRVEPRDLLVVNGLFPLYTRALRSLFDVTVWLDPEPELQIAWKTQRDVLERGYAPAQVRDELVRRTADVERYVAQQRRFADLTVRFYRPPGFGPNGDPRLLSAQIRKGGRFRSLDYGEFESASTSIRTLETQSGGFPETVIELDGRIEPDIALGVERRIWSHIDSGDRDLPELGRFKDASGASKIGYALALAQLLISRRVVLVENELLEMAS